MLNQKTCFGVLFRLPIFFLILASDDTKNSPKLCFACYCKIRTLSFFSRLLVEGHISYIGLYDITAISSNFKIKSMISLYFVYFWLSKTH